MKARQFEVGDHVHVMDRSLSGPATGETFEIIERYAVEGSEPMYRLLGLKGDERVAPENELRRQCSTLSRAVEYERVQVARGR